MEQVKLVYDEGRYRYTEFNLTRMAMIGIFLSSDVGCRYVATYKRWALDDKSAPGSQYLYTYSSDATLLEEENGNIFLDFIFPEEDDSLRSKMTRQQFVQLLDDWQEKVCVPRPKEVIIKYENDQYAIETSN